MLGIEPADDFFPRIWVEMNRRRDDLSKLRLVFIGAGAEWIWHRVAAIDHPDSVHILDFCHAVDHPPRAGYRAVRHAPEAVARQTAAGRRCSDR